MDSPGSGTYPRSFYRRRRDSYRLAVARFPADRRDEPASSMKYPTAPGAPTWSVSDHQSPKGADLVKRYQGLERDVQTASRNGLWQYFRVHEGRVGLSGKVFDEEDRSFLGVNVGSQDYLGLANDPRVAQSAIHAIQSHGVHSSGSAPMGGGSRDADRLAEQIAHILGVRNALLFPTGWAAGYGVIKGVIRPHDYIVMDALCHNCLQHGAYAATPNVSLFSHNSLPSLEKRLARIRSNNPDAAILIVTESLFSMDSDGPDLSELVALKSKYRASLLLDIAHDFGVLGETGRGCAEGQIAYSDVELIIGSFSKVFANIGGFFATDHLALIRGVQGFSGSYTFSNFLTPPQIGAVTEAFRIAFSEEGQHLRHKVLQNSQMLRQLLEERRVATFGYTSAMVIVQVGAEAIARTAYKRLLSEGIILNCIEFPAVRKGESRFRLQLTPQHDDPTLLRRLASGIASAIATSAAEVRTENKQTGSKAINGLESQIT